LLRIPLFPVLARDSQIVKAVDAFIPDSINRLKSSLRFLNSRDFLEVLLRRAIVTPFLTFFPGSSINPVTCFFRMTTSLPVNHI
jgi:hypothetical protein